MRGPVTPGALEPVAVEVPQGASSAQVANVLYQKRLIKNPSFFSLYARYRHLDSQLKSGEYELNRSMGLDEVLNRLTRGETVERRFIIPEGLTVSMTADLLAQQGLVDREAFLAKAREFGAKNGFLPTGAGLTQPMEGYLFPAAYEYKPGVTADEILQMMYSRTEQVWTPELLKRAQEMGISVHQVMTLASIVEAEARVPAERPVIAGVYENRLAIDMALQADPTVYYALDLPRGERLLYRHLKVDSPYNTYRYPGLPPGPICAPGEAAIKAVLYPEKHQYLYFVAKEDGSGEHYFSRTLEEHEENIAKAEANAAKR